MVKFFYQNNFLQFEIDEGQTRAFLRTPLGPMAVLKQSNNRICTELLPIDRSGSVIDPFIYTCFGDSTVCHSQPPLLAFNAQRPDPFTRCYLLGNGRRVYNPVLMRFQTTDAFSPFEKGGVNAYAYCEGDPVNWQDESGFVRERTDRLTTASNTHSANTVNPPIGTGALVLKQNDKTKHQDSNKRKVSFSTEITTASPILIDSKLVQPLSNLTKKQHQKLLDKRQAVKIDKSRTNLIALGKEKDTLNKLEKLLYIARKVSQPEIVYDFTKVEKIRLEEPFLDE